MVENAEASEKIFFLHVFIENLITVDFLKKKITSNVIIGT